MSLRSNSATLAGRMAVWRAIAIMLPVLVVFADFVDGRIRFSR